MADPRSPQQHAAEAQSCRGPYKDHSGQYVVCGDPDTHRQPAKTDAIGPVNTPSSNDTTVAGMISAANPASN